MIILNEKKGKTDPRKIAFLILIKYFKKKGSLKDVLNCYLKDYKLSALDRRFISGLVKGTVRYHLKIDFILSLFSVKNIKDIDFGVLIILRMGIFQLIYMNKVPDYSTVDESVKLARKNVSVSSSKFVNAVLRKISSIRDIDLFAEEKIEKLYSSVIDKISINYSYPRWLIEYWLDWYGKEKTILICKSLNENPHNYLRINKNKLPLEDLIRELNEESVKSKPVSFNTGEDGEPVSDYLKAEDGNYKFSQDSILKDAVEVASVQDINRKNAYIKGLISVQDISSQIAVKHFLKPCRGEKILDVCAAPGGKTTYIAELVGDEGEVISVDISKERLGMLKENLTRLNINIVKVVEADATKEDFLERRKNTIYDGNPEDKTIYGDYTGYFDKILIDAPCSAFGTISKNPDVKYNKTMDDIVRLSEMSYTMIVNCDRYLKTGGRLLFYTCTLSPVENQQVIGKFLREFNGKYAVIKPGIFDMLASILNFKKGIACLDGKEDACFEMMPYYFGSEAGFICSLIKKL